MKKAAKRAPWPVIFLIVAFLCPTELSLYVAGLRFPPHRVALSKPSGRSRRSVTAARFISDWIVCEV